MTTTMKTARIALRRASVEQQCRGNARPTHSTWKLETDCRKMTYDQLMEQLGKKKPANRQFKRIGGKMIAYEAAIRKVEFSRRKSDKAERIADICQRIARERNPNPIINHVSVTLPRSTVASIITSGAFKEHTERIHASGGSSGMVLGHFSDPLDELIAKEDLEAALKDQEDAMRLEIRSMRLPEKQ